MTVITRSTSRPICWVKTFPPLCQDRKWAGDMYYIWTNEGWRYLAVILSLFLASDWLGPSRTCCANPAGQWSAIELVAVALRQPPRGCSHHTDRGSQCCSGGCQNRITKHSVAASMRAKGNCYDNSKVETFFKTITAELIWRTRWETRCQAEGAIFQHINGPYNPRHHQSSLGGKSPSAFERKAA